MALAQSSAEKQQLRHKELYNRKAKGQPVSVADRVLLANKAERGKNKRANRCDGRIDTVVSRNETIHQIKSPLGSVNTVHRNLIMPVNFLPPRAK